MIKSCGGCQHWQKTKYDRHGPVGLCELHDCRAKSDSTCSSWKAIPYDRKKAAKEHIE